MAEKENETPEKLNVNVSLISTKDKTTISIKGTTEETIVDGNLSINYKRPNDFGSSNYRDTLYQIQNAFAKIFNN